MHRHGLLGAIKSRLKNALASKVFNGRRKLKKGCRKKNIKTKNGTGGAVANDKVFGEHQLLSGTTN